jgi:hypothetical protein
MASNYCVDAPQKQTKTSAFRSLLSHKRTPSAGATLMSTPTNDVFISSHPYDSEHQSSLAFNYPHSRALGELQQNQQTQGQSTAQKSREGKRPSTSGEEKAYLHKKTLSTVSLKTFAGKDGDKASKEAKPKKTKSSTNLGKLLSRPKSSKSLRKRAAEDEDGSQKNKENYAPSPSISPTEVATRPPIYAQFSSERFIRQPQGGKFVEDQIDLYTPKDNYPEKHRDFGVEQPPIVRHDEVKQRPNSTNMPSSSSIQNFSREVSGDSSRLSAELQGRISREKRPSADRKATDSSTKSGKQGSSRGQQGRNAPVPKSKEPEIMLAVLQDKDVEREFEAMLDRRNIPEHQRGKMRSLAMSMKKDFVKQDWAEIEAAKSSRPGTNGSDSSADATEGAHEVPVVKSKRPRSRTFTLSKSWSKEPASPEKKQKSTELTLNRLRNKSTESLVGGHKSLKESGAHVAQTLIAKAKGQLPDDFVSYLRKVQQPESVEVGRLHKLRLLLRNETVAWTDEFIQKGGMAEIVGLLQRTMEVEWRYG